MTFVGAGILTDCKGPNVETLLRGGRTVGVPAA